MQERLLAFAKARKEEGRPGRPHLLAHFRDLAGPPEVAVMRAQHARSVPLLERLASGLGYAGLAAEQEDVDLGSSELEYARHEVDAGNPAPEHDALSARRPRYAHAVRDAEVRVADGSPQLAVGAGQHGDLGVQG